MAATPEILADAKAHLERLSISSLFYSYAILCARFQEPVNPMPIRERRWLGLVIGIVLFSFGAVMEASKADAGLMPDFLIFMGGAVAMWMTAKLFWTDDPSQWFFFVVSLGWLFALALSMNMLRRGVLL